jgi:hypothetical protein
MTAQDGTDDTPTDAYLSLLANRYRRAVLLSLIDHGGNDAEPISIEEAVSDSIPERVEVALNHNHLPKLANHEVIRWNRDEGSVAPGPAFEEIEPFLEALDNVRTKLPNDWRPDLDD